MEPKVISVPDRLRGLAGIYEERNVLYGDNYKKFGPIIQAMFPNGVRLNCGDDHNRWGILVQIVAKLTRYAANFEHGGHADSLDDMAVYAMMLQELDLSEPVSDDERDDPPFPEPSESPLFFDPPDPVTSVTVSSPDLVTSVTVSADGESGDGQLDLFIDASGKIAPSVEDDEIPF